MYLTNYFSSQLARGREISRDPVVTEPKSAEPGSEHKGGKWKGREWKGREWKGREFQLAEREFPRGNGGEDKV